MTRSLHKLCTGTVIAWTLSFLLGRGGREGGRRGRERGEQGRREVERGGRRGEEIGEGGEKWREGSEGRRGGEGETLPHHLCQQTSMLVQ